MPPRLSRSSEYYRDLDEQQASRTLESLQSRGQTYTKLMRQMSVDASHAPSLFHPGSYWKPHADRMISVVERYGIENFRRIPDKAVAAFNTGNHWTPRDTRALRLIRGLSRLPGIGRLARALIADIDAGYIRARSEGHFKLRAVYHWLKETEPDLIELEDRAIGNPVTFSIDGREFSEAFLLKLLEFSLLRRHLDFASVSSIIEIGGSYGLLADVILTRYPTIRYTLVDIAPVAAFARYYLDHRFPDSDRVTVKCAHELASITGLFDLFINVASFQEMDRDQVKLYCSFAAEKVSRVYLNNNARSASNSLTTNDYRDLLGMSIDAQWNNPLHPSYQPTLLRRSEAP